jgi:hypothetical protein
LHVRVDAREKTGIALNLAVYNTVAPNARPPSLYRGRGDVSQSAFGERLSSNELEAS